MTVSEKVQAVLEGDGRLTALVPTDRIRVPGDWQNLARPYIVHFPVSVEPIQCHDGRPAMTIWPDYQVSIFADDFGQAEDLAVVVRDALEGNHNGMQVFWERGWFIGQEIDPPVFHFALGFRIAEAPGDSPP